MRLEVAGIQQSIHARYVIGADGATSRVARDLGLSTNQHWIVGLEEVYEGAKTDGPPQLHCFLDHRFAPGYVAWIAVDSDSVHVGVGGYRDKFQPSPALDAFRETIGHVVNLDGAQLVERRGGRIPVGGVLPNLANARGLLIGDAAGAVSPLTAGGLDPCLRLSELAAKVVHRYLESGDAAHLAAYDGRRFRRQFLARARCVQSIPWPDTTCCWKPAARCCGRPSGARWPVTSSFRAARFPTWIPPRRELPRPSARQSKNAQAVAVN